MTQPHSFDQIPAGPAPAVRAQRGASTVELALLLVPLILTLLGSVELGRYFWTQHVVTSAATEGARMAILNEPSNAEVQNKVTQVMVQGGINTAPSVNISGRAANQPVTVTVSIPYSIIGLSRLIPALGQIVTINSASTMTHVP